MLHYSGKPLRQDKAWKEFRCFFVIFLALMLIPAFLGAQEDSRESSFGESDFGFGDFGSGDSGGGLGFSPSSAFSFSISGELEAGLRLFISDLKGGANTEASSAMDMLFAKINFGLAGKNADVFLGLKLSSDSLVELKSGPGLAETPLILDEAYVRGFFGPVTIVGGIRKITWGKADSFGPLDVVNPLDFTDLTKLSDPQSVKIARPMIHASWAMGSFTKLEAVFVPWFQGDTFDTTGKWTPGQMKDLQNFGNLFGINIDNFFPETNTMEYAQAGMRFTTSIGSSDFGFQYFYGRLNRPAVNYNFFTPALNINYNYYHQIAADFARVISGFNLRAEAGVNITGDLDGKDGAIENPAFVWSLGFDRDLFWRINLNLQGTGKLRFFHDRVGNVSGTDCEAGSDASSTRITGIISRKFLRDELELKTSVLWGIEDSDFLVMPAFIWSRNDVSTELSAGFFGGDKKGELGQYKDNGFVRVILTYKF